MNNICIILLILMSLMFGGCSNQSPSSYTPEQFAHKSALIEDLNSADHKIVSTSVFELQRRLNMGKLPDIDDKYDIYNKIKSSSHNVMVIQNVVRLLSNFPPDNKILRAAKEDLQSPNTNCFIAGFTYLINKDENYLVENYKFDDYERIDPFLRGVFQATTPIKNWREKWLHDNIELFMKLFLSKSNMQEENIYKDNPYRLKLLGVGLSYGEGNYVANYIVSHADQYAVPVLPNGLIWLLGEIGDPCATELLLSAHCNKPTYRSSISLGACVGPSQLELIVKNFNNESKNMYLKSILTPNEYQEIKESTDEDIIMYLTKNWEKLKKRNRYFSIPLIQIDQL
jgi:hypothetical protein